LLSIRFCVRKYLSLGMGKQKPPVIKYGVEITKPWSEEMYAHNEQVREQVIAHLKNAINDAHSRGLEDLLRYLAKQVAGHSYGEGFSLQQIHDDAMEQLDHLPTYWLNEIYPYLVIEDEVPAVEPFFIGFKD
jgi:hypothetical protein